MQHPTPCVPRLGRETPPPRGTPMLATAVWDEDSPRHHLVHGLGCDIDGDYVIILLWGPGPSAEPKRIFCVGLARGHPTNASLASALLTDARAQTQPALAPPLGCMSLAHPSLLPSSPCPQLLDSRCPPGSLKAPLSQPRSQSLGLNVVHSLSCHTTSLTAPLFLCPSTS